MGFKDLCPIGLQNLVQDGKCPMVSKSLKHLVPDNPYETFDFHTVGENNYRSGCKTATNQLLTGRNGSGRERCVDKYL
jgi:hypothetical protein